ncbi:MAG: glycoside hydrolase family 20 zincin-like fold domain-containing protein [Ginsengibacter sp.]
MILKNHFVSPGTMLSLGRLVCTKLLIITIFYFLVPKNAHATGLTDAGLYVIPYPQKVVIEGDNFIFNNSLHVVLDKNHSPSDEFAAEELIHDLRNEWNITAELTNKTGLYSIVLTRQKNFLKPGKQGYQLIVSKNGIIIRASGEEGLFYGTQTLLQLIQKNGSGHKVIGLKINDWPDIAERAVHYDNKHHQDKIGYVKNFIKELAHYKINLLIWEWEDKFAYPSHPEIGAPGAFTPKEIQGLTDYARMYHIQIVPLVQGLGHASFILKWPQFAPFRELAASNFEFCPLKEGSYNLLFDLWKDAMDATKGSEYLHIGCDETYEVGLCDQCTIKAKEIGRDGLFHLFVRRCARYIISQGRKPMTWESTGEWAHENSAEKMAPTKGLTLTEDVTKEGVDTKKIRQSNGYKAFFYDPNPGIERLFLPYFYREREGGKILIGCLENSYNVLKEAAASGAFDGVFKTSWDDAGMHNQVWMLCFLTAAEFSWNGHTPGLGEFTETFFKNYYGAGSVKLKDLFYLLNESTYYFWDTFERKIWDFGDVGKTYLPDLPGGDALEYDPYWNKQYKEMIGRSRLELQKMDTALSIIKANKNARIRHAYDIEIFETLVNLVRHTCNTYLDLSNLEYAIGQANRLTFINRDSAYYSLQNAVKIIESNLQERARVFNNLVNTWEKTRMVKGTSTADKKYFYMQDRTRHFANRRPDMSYLIYDEQRLGLEDYLEKLKAYMKTYKSGSF